MQNRLWNNDEAMNHHLKYIYIYLYKYIYIYIYINQIIVIIYTNINFK